MILWLRDLVAGAGWGIVDDRGRPKTTYHHLRRVLAPTAAWLIDEGIGGVVAHIANDGPDPLSARLRVALYTDLELRVAEGDERLELPAHGAAQRDIEVVIGHFVDAAWAYRFGPPAHDAIVVSLERDGASGPELLSQDFHFPAGRPLTLEPAQRLGLSATACSDVKGIVRLSVTSRRLAYGVRIHVPGFAMSDDAFSVEPGRTRAVQLQPTEAGTAFPGGEITALNMTGRVAIVATERLS
jgi:beta-mannosidase